VRGLCGRGYHLIEKAKVVNVEHKGPLPEPDSPNNVSANANGLNFERWGPWTERAGAEARANDDETQPLRTANTPDAAPTPKPTPQAQRGQDALPVDPQFTHREHVTGMLLVPPYPVGALQAPAYPAAPGQVPPYPQAQQRSQYPPQRQQQAPPYQHYPGNQYPYPPGNGAYPQPGTGYPWPGGYHAGYPYPYPPYPYAPYPYAPYGRPPMPQVKHDGFHLAVSIVALICSILAILGGIGSVFFLIFLAFVPHSTLTEGDYLSSLMTFTAFSISGMVGGGFSLYHSIRGLMRKPSGHIILPWFWIFLVLYLLAIGVGYALEANGLAVQYLPLTMFLIVLVAIFPALALAAFGVRRLRFPQWPTTWRRFSLAITSGATLGIGLALLLELGLLVLVLRSQATNFNQYLTGSTPGNTSFGMFALIFLVVAIIGPVVEETVKPLGVAFYIGRIRSAAEAFTLGMSAGIGFALVETVGYIGSGYQNWLGVALERTAASLLHGFGAGMVALGWYYLTHDKHHPKRRALGYWAYAVLQHLVWNGTAVLAFLPAPAGPALNNVNLNLGFTQLPILELLNILEAIAILVFFVYITGRLRRQTPQLNENKPQNEQLYQPSESTMAKV
jgi:RsiW-degrading membrane proteinase PrsW (M82 family)